MIDEACIMPYTNLDGEEKKEIEGVANGNEGSANTALTLYVVVPMPCYVLDICVCLCVYICSVSHCSVIYMWHSNIYS